MDAPSAPARSPGRRELLGLALIGALSWAASAQWLARHRAEPSADEFRYYDMACRIRAALDQPDRHTFSRILEAHDTHPPLQPLLAALLMPVVGRDVRALAAALDAIATVVLLAAFWWLARRTRTRGAAPAAAFLLACFPTFVVLGHTFLIDLPAAAFTMLALAALVASRDLERPGPSLVAGLALGLALLTKWTAAAALGVPFALAAIRSLRRGGSRAPLFLMAGAALLAAGPWYVTHARRVWGFYRWNEGLEPADVGQAVGQGALDPETLLFYARQLPLILGPVGIAAAALGLLFGRRGAPGLVWAVLVPFAAFSALRMKSDIPGRYLILALPPVAWLAGAALARLGPRVRRAVWWGAGVLLVAGALPAMGLLGPGAPLGLAARAPTERWLARAYPPIVRAPGEEEVWRRVAAAARTPDDRLLAVCFYGPLEWTCAYLAARDGARFRLVHPPQADAASTGFEELLGAPMILQKTGLPAILEGAGRGELVRGWHRFLADPPPAFASHHESFARIPLGDRSRAVLLRRTAPPDLAERREVAAGSLRMRPGDPAVFRMLAGAEADAEPWRATAGALEEAGRDAGAAEDRLRAIAARAPGEPLVHEARAWAALRAGRAAAAVEAAEAAGTGGAGLGPLFLGRGLLALGRRDEARAAFERGAAGDALLDAAWDGIAEVEEAGGRAAEAARARRRAHLIQSGWSAPYRHPAELLELTELLVKEERFREALPLIRAGLIAQQTEGPWPGLLALALPRVRPAAEALAELEEVIEWHPVARDAARELRALCAEPPPAPPR